MHAMALPENDPDDQAAAICRFHDRMALSLAARGPVPATEAVRVPAAHDGTAHRRAPAGRGASTRAASTRAASTRGASSRTARGQAPRTQITAGAPLRLTRRGRVVIAIAAALLVTVVSLIATGAAQATNHSVPPRVAAQNLSRVVVRPGQSLWSVAESADPNADTRLVIRQIVELNGLTGDVVLAGQRLWVPRG